MIDEILHRVHFLAILLGCSSHFSGWVQPTLLPLFAPADCPRENSAKLLLQLCQQCLVLLFLWNRHRERHQVDTAPNPEIGLADGGLVVCREEDLERGRELERPLVEFARRDDIATGQLLDDRLIQVAALCRFDR